MLIPRKVKHRKWHKGRRIGKQVATRGTELSFGSFGLKSTTYGWVTSRQIEASRRAMVRYIKRGGKVWIRIFPDKPITNHGSEATMGGGKGSPEYFVAVVKPGTVVFEIEGIPEDMASEAMRLAGHKLPLQTKFIAK